jgi:hypothetical protein
MHPGMSAASIYAESVLFCKPYSHRFWCTLRAWHSLAISTEGLMRSTIEWGVVAGVEMEIDCQPVYRYCYKGSQSILISSIPQSQRFSSCLARSFEQLISPSKPWFESHLLVYLQGHCWIHLPSALVPGSSMNSVLLSPTIFAVSVQSFKIYSWCSEHLL